MPIEVGYVGSYVESDDGVRKRTGGLALAVAVMSVVACAMLVTKGAGAAEPSGARSMQSDPWSFREIASRVAPSVVKISADGSALNGEWSGFDGIEIPDGSPLEPFFRQFIEQKSRRWDMHAQRWLVLGSGFIVSPDGFIVTNRHVVENAKRIFVTLSDRERLQAKIAGEDRGTDNAVLKIDAEEKLPSVSFGNSDEAMVGDWVMAVGHPFGLGGTVTVGVISARGRDLEGGPYDDFLQIDAAIDRENSGGPTFNVKGEVIGVNSAIYSPNGGNAGTGFSIPSNLASPIVEQIRRHGSVERGWMGVQIQEISAPIADGLGLESDHGALVVSVANKSPAHVAGIMPGDVVKAVNGDEIRRFHDLPRIISDLRPGATAIIEVWRDGMVKSVEMKIGSMSDEWGGRRDKVPSDDETVLGMSLSDDAGEDPGVLVTGVKGEAANAGIIPGDIIRRIGRIEVTTAHDVAQAMNGIKDRKNVLLMVVRNGAARFIALPKEG